MTAISFLQSKLKMQNCGVEFITGKMPVPQKSSKIKVQSFSVERTGKQKKTKKWQKSGDYLRV